MGDIPMVQHFDPFRVNRFKPADPRYLEREVAMQRESRALAGSRHPAGTKLRVADFWRLYYQNQATVDAASAQIATARGSSVQPQTTGRSENGKNGNGHNTARSVNFAASTSTTGEKQQQQQQEQQQVAVAELNAPVPAGGNATCIGVVDGGLTILVGRENGRIAVVDGLRGRVVQDIDVALAARERILPRRREVQASLKLQEEEPAGEQKKMTAEETSSKPSAQQQQQQQQQEQQPKRPMCPHDAQEAAMELNPATNRSRDASGLSTEPQPITCVTPFTPRALGRPVFIAGSAHGKLFLFDSTTLTFLAQVDVGADDKVEEIRWLSESSTSSPLTSSGGGAGGGASGTTELIVRNKRGDLFVVEVTTSETPQDDDVRNIVASVSVPKRRDAVPPKQANNPPPTIVSMVALSGTVWVGDAAGGIHTLDEQDLGRVQFASEDFPLYAVRSDADSPAVLAVAVGGSFCYAAVEDRIHVLPLSGMPKDCIPLSTLTAHKARVVSLDFDQATGRLWSRDVSGFVACYDGTSKSGFALRTTMQLPTEGQQICDIKFCSYETHVRLWTLASNGLNKQWCSGFAAGSTDATNQASLNEADIEVDSARVVHWTELVAQQLQLVDRRRAAGAASLGEFERTRTLAEAFAVWLRFRRLKQFLRIQPLHAQMLVGQADLALMGKTFRRWLHFRLEKRVKRIHEGGARLVLRRLEEERQAAYFRRWVQFRELRRQQRDRASASTIIGAASHKLVSGAYFEKWKEFALRHNLRKRRSEMGNLVYERWAVSRMQQVYDILKRNASIRRAKRLDATAVTVMATRLNTVRMTHAFALWRRMSTIKRRRNEQKKWAESSAKFVMQKRRQLLLHVWMRASAKKREQRHIGQNEQIEAKLSAAQTTYMANQAHIERVRLLKTLTKQLADLAQEQSTVSQRLSQAETASAQSRQEMAAARDAAMDPSVRGTVIGSAQIIGRAMLGQAPGADAKAAQAAAKEGPGANARNVALAARSICDAIDAAEINSRVVPQLDTDVDGFGAKIGRDKAAAYVDAVRRLAVSGLATSLAAVSDETIVDEATTQFILANTDGLALSAVRLQSNPPPPSQVISKPAAASVKRSSSAAATGTTTTKRSASPMTAKRSASPTTAGATKTATTTAKKTTTAAPAAKTIAKPAAKRPTLATTTKR